MKLKLMSQVEELSGLEVIKAACCADCGRSGKKVELIRINKDEVVCEDCYGM